MPRPKLTLEEAKIKRQQRNQRYRDNIVAKQHNLEHDKLYRQRRREQIRLADHQDPLAQLANIETRQEYLAAGDSQTHLPTATTRTEEVVDVAGTIQEDGEILDNFGNEGEVNGFES